MTTQTVTFDHNEHEVSAWLTANMVRCDYGVRGSPVWYEAEDIDVDQVEVDGQMFTEKDLIANFGKDFATGMIEAAIEKADENGWSQ